MHIICANSLPGICKYFLSKSEKNPPRALANKFIKPKREAIRLAEFGDKILQVFGSSNGTKVVVVVMLVVCITSFEPTTQSFL